MLYVGIGFTVLIMMISVLAHWVACLEHQLSKLHNRVIDLRLEFHTEGIDSAKYAINTDDHLLSLCGAGIKLAEDLEKTKKELLELQICMTNHLGMGQQAPQPDEPTIQRLQDKA